MFFPTFLLIQQAFYNLNGWLIFNMDKDIVYIQGRMNVKGLRVVLHGGREKKKKGEEKEEVRRRSPEEEESGGGGGWWS